MAQTVLVLGGTGNVGLLLLQQLLEGGNKVRAIVRSESKLAETITAHSNFTLIRGSLLDLSQSDLQTHVTGCDAVISTLGHVMNLRGVFGPPYLLVTEAAKRICRAIEAVQPTTPTKYILLNTVGVSNPGDSDRTRGWFEASFLRLLGTLLPPLIDSYRSAVFLSKELGTNSKYVEWTAVRPDAFLDGQTSTYTLHEQLQSSLFNPGHTRKSNIAHFMCQLVNDQEAWAKWKGKMPVILDAE